MARIYSPGEWKLGIPSGVVSYRWSIRLSFAGRLQDQNRYDRLLAFACFFTLSKSYSPRWRRLFAKTDLILVNFSALERILVSRSWATGHRLKDSSTYVFGGDTGLYDANRFHVLVFGIAQNEP